MKPSKSIYFLIVSLLFICSCKKDTPIYSATQTNDVNGLNWTKTSDFVNNGKVFDYKKLNPNNIALLTTAYWVMDSNLNLQFSEPQSSLIDNFKAKNLTNPFYLNAPNYVNKKEYLIQNYFDTITGKITNKRVFEPKDFINITDNGYGLLLDYGIDNTTNKWMKLFLKTEFDTATNVGKQFNVLVGIDMKTGRKSFEKEFGDYFSRVVTTKKGYMLYSNNGLLMRFLDRSLIALDTNIFRTAPTSVFATDNMFYIQNSYGFFSTENGQQFTWVSTDFTAKRLINDNLMYGVKEHKPCILNLIDGTTTFLPTTGLAPNTYIKDCEAIVIDDKIVLFTNSGVYQISYKN